MGLGTTSSSAKARIGVLLFIFFCILSFLNRSPYGEPSKAVAFAIEQGNPNDSTYLFADRGAEENWKQSDPDEKPQKTWKKYVLDKVIVPAPVLLFAEARYVEYQLHGVDRHSLSYRFSGLAPPFIA